MNKLKRNLSTLENKKYDLIIIGGGIFGVCAAWDAALRGLSVAIIEKNDFSHATSANHFKMVHGGIRYLQHGDIFRIRESSKERSALLRIAPHLVRPLPIVIPTYGHRMKGKEIIGTGLLLYNLITIDRNRNLRADRVIPNGKLLSRREIIETFPGIKQKKLTGGVLFYDGQIYNPPRLAISFLRSAVSKGVDAANYVEATGFIKKCNKIIGIEATDTLNGNVLNITGNIILNTAGPWGHRILESKLGIKINPRPTFSRDLAFVVNRKFSTEYALAFSTETKDKDALVDVGGRRLFAVPWREYTLIGVWHRVCHKNPDDINVTERELREFVDEVNHAYPALSLEFKDILMINTGLTLFGEESKQKSRKMSFGKRSLLIDHRIDHCMDGLLSLIGVRATTARGMAEKAVDRVMDKLGKNEVKSKTHITPIYGGNIASCNTLVSTLLKQSDLKIDEKLISALSRNYGCGFEEILKYIWTDHSLGETIGLSSTILKAEVIHAVRQEMAQTLADVIFRRTELATGCYPDKETLTACADLMAREMGWSEERKKQELASVAAPKFF